MFNQLSLPQDHFATTTTATTTTTTMFRKIDFVGLNYFSKNQHSLDLSCWGLSVFFFFHSINFTLKNTSLLCFDVKLPKVNNLVPIE